MKMTGNTILVTGGVSGIGRALAEGFHSLGNQVLIAGRRRSLLEKLAAVSSETIPSGLDIEGPGSISRMAKQWVEKFPELNVSINNAGIKRNENLLSHAFSLEGFTEICIDRLKRLRFAESTGSCEAFYSQFNKGMNAIQKDERGYNQPSA